MLQNRPRGVFQQNKNAANIQLGSTTDSGLTFETLKPVPVDINNINKPDLIQSQRTTTVGDENFTLPLKKLQPVELDNENVLFKNLKEDTFKPQLSPKEPSPPKLKSYNHLKQQSNKQEDNVEANQDVDILIDLSDESTKKPLSKVEPTQKSQLILFPGDENKPQAALNTQQESAASRIPRLSLRFSNVPVPQKSNVFDLGAAIKNDQVTRKPAAARCLGPLLEAKSRTAEPTPSDRSEDIHDIDKSTSRDAIFLVCDVAKDIYEYLYDLEKTQSVSENFLKDQSIMTPKVRQRLINWCISINQQLKLLPETLYITVSIIDRFFERFIVGKQHQVQLFASAATLIASKYEEIYPPYLDDLTYLAQNNYSKKEILRAEIYMLKILDFDLGKPIPLSFLRRFSKAANCTLKMHSIAKYLMELSLTEYECAHWAPSLLAAASLFTSLFLIAANSRETPSSTSSNGSRSVGSKTFPRLTRSALSQNSALSIAERVWTNQIVHYSKYTKEEVLGPASTLCKILKRSQKSPSSFETVKKNLQELTKWPELKTPKVDDLIKLGDRD